MEKITTLGKNNLFYISIVNMLKIFKMKNLILLFSLIMVVSCQETINTEISKELTVLDNSDSEEITFILELNTKGNSVEEVENFNQYHVVSHLDCYYIFQLK